MIHTLDLKFQGEEKTIAAYLLETYDGPLLFETGPYSCFPQMEKELGRFGYTVYDIQHVFLTHIHLDHAGAAWAFAEQGATIHVHPNGLRHLASPERLMESARRIYQDKMDELWGDMNPIAPSQLLSTAHESEYTVANESIKAWHTPGHAIHHIAWQVKDELITGDVAGVKIGADGFVVPPCPPPDINLEDWKNSIELIRKIKPSALYLAQFGKVTDCEVHLGSLLHILDDWANWMRIHWDAGDDPEEVTPLFQAYVHEQLVKAGIPPEDLPKYEKANPSWMSVAGLMRYWSKLGY
jgi:glyoxylase-like metal-dependent hydrolase (beta-lactamase superfamily II)